MYEVVAADDRSGTALSVVVAEDEALIRIDLVEMLGELGHQVVGQAGDGQQAVDLVRALRPDLVFLDVAMPLRDGLSAAEEIGTEAMAPVVMITAFSQRQTVERAAAAGVMGYLVKPFTRSDLAPVIEVARARWTSQRELQQQIGNLQSRLTARQAVERATSRIQERLGVSEPEAFRLLRRWAMDARLTLGEAAMSYLDHPPGTERSRDSGPAV